MTTGTPSGSYAAVRVVSASASASSGCELAGEVVLGQAEHRRQAAVVGRDQAAVDHARAGRRRGQGHDDDQLVGIGDDRPLGRVGVVGGAAQDADPVRHRDDPRERTVASGHVADQAYPVADDDRGAAHVGTPHRDDRGARIEQPAGGAAPVDGRDQRLAGVGVLGPQPAAPPVRAAGTDRYVVLVERTRHAPERRQLRRPRRAAAPTARESRAWSCRWWRCPTPARPARADPATAYAIASRWSARGSSTTPRPASGAGVMCSPSAVTAIRAPEPSELLRQRGEPVGLLPAQVSDPAQAGRGVGEQRDRRQRRHGLAVVAEIEVDAVQPLRPGDLELTPRPSPRTGSRRPTSSSGSSRPGCDVAGRPPRQPHAARR